MSEPETIEDAVFNYRQWLTQIGNTGAYISNGVTYDKWTSGLYSRCVNWGVYNEYMGPNVYQTLRTGLASLSLTWSRPLSQEVIFDLTFFIFSLHTHSFQFYSLSLIQVTLIQLDQVPSVMSVDHNRTIGLSYIA